MIVKPWDSGRRKTIVCLDSYHNGVPRGRLYTPWQEARTFESLSQFLIKMENLMDELQMPQSYTAARTFCVAEDSQRDACNL